ncbi:MAG: hypothetical protein SAJ12_22155 [Jaaginema sp. PMC 1079.18]|nr:hypothetical protein [Jaaginema sp. PMC 1080.18]MEC4853695.1 hypothetical protein [Jaaginema sp. PMC 1079.18]MEC4869021.1 hypothetical protein [Jaaginema sp. PMC 1078.18]
MQSSLLTKVSGIFCFPAIFYAVWLVLSRKKKLYSRLSFSFAIATVFTGILVASYYLWAIYISKNFPPYYIAANQYWVWKHGLSYFLENYYFLPKLYHQLQFFWTLPIIVLVVFGVFCPFKDIQLLNDRKIERLPYFFHFWLLGCVLYYLIAAKGLVDNPTNLNLANPAVAALTANALIFIGTILKRFLKQPLAIALLIITLIYLTGVTQKAIRQVLFYPWAEKEYQLGLVLKEVSQTDDLVITMAPVVGDTTILYYSQRRGWTFPPAYVWSDLDDFTQIDAETSLKLLKELQAKNADWLGITASRLEQLAENNPLMLQYIQDNFELYQDQADFKIYRLPE